MLELREELKTKEKYHFQKEDPKNMKTKELKEWISIKDTALKETDQKRDKERKRIKMKKNIRESDKYRK